MNGQVIHIMQLMNIFNALIVYEQITPKSFLGYFTARNDDDYEEYDSDEDYYDDYEQYEQYDSYEEPEILE